MYFDHTSTGDQFAELLVGRKIVKAQNNALWLDNGLILKITPNDGGCSCGAGDYRVTDLNTCNNIITSCNFVHSTPRNGCESPNTWKLFVFADNTAVNAFTVDGDDGNGYYGTGFHITVTEATPGDPDARKRGLNDHLLRGI